MIFGYRVDISYIQTKGSHKTNGICDESTTVIAQSELSASNVSVTRLFNAPYRLSYPD